MSGLEVAGLILGSFPIALVALEKYQKVAQVMGFWYEIRREYQRSLHDLKFYRLSFTRNLKQLLLPLIPDDAQLDGLITDPGGATWRDADIQKALEARLHDSYGLYLEVLNEMQRVLQELNQELAVDNEVVQSKVHANEPCSSKTMSISGIRQSFDRSNRKYQAFRIKFSVGQRTRTRLFLELQKYNDRLEKLLSSSAAVAILEEARDQHTPASSQTSSSTVHKFWSQADKLYRALLAAWNCSCRDEHRAQLFLQHRLPDQHGVRLRLESGIQDAGQGDKWSMCPVMVEMLDQPPAETTKGVTVIGEDHAATSTPQHRTKAPVGSALAKTAGRKSLRVRLEAPPTESTTVVYTQAVTFSTSEGRPTTYASTLVRLDPRSRRITDLCDILITSKLSVRFGWKWGRRALGYIDAIEDASYGLYVDKDLPWDQKNISLSQVLRGETNRPFTRRQRYQLSLTVASSFVQLKDTAWLQTRWGKECIRFNVADEGLPRLDLPFIISHFRDDKDKVGEKTRSEHDVAGIASLGILLLELCFGRVIEHVGVEDERVRAALDMMEALELLKDVNDEAGADYADAVEWCITGCRRLPSDGTWRMLMVEKVVEPLERCYGYLG